MKLQCACGRKLQVPDSLLGRRIRCPFCQAALLVEPQEELPLALDHEPRPGELLNHKLAADAEAAESDGAEALSALAAVVGETSPELPLARSAIEEPEVAPGPTASAAAPSAPAPQAPPEASPSAGHAGAGPVPGAAAAGRPELAMAAGGTTARPASARPARAAQSSPGAGPRPAAPRRPARNGVALARMDEDEDQPQRKRDLLPLILSGAAALIFIGLIVGFIYAVTHRPMQAADKEQRPSVVTSPIKQAPTSTESTSTSAGYEFFGHIPPNRTSADYQKEQEKKQDKQ